MPPMIVKLWPGKAGAQKRDLSDAIVEGVTRILGYGQAAVSVGFEEIAPGDWDARVHAPDIAAHWADLTKKPGYGTPPVPQER
jgi:4-oxalocrotonate tautomerase